MAPINLDLEQTHAFTRYQLFLLSKIIDLYKEIERSGALNDFQLGFAILSELCDLEEMALRTGVTREAITHYVNSVFDQE